MADKTERVTATTTIEAAREAVFGVLADPSAHADIDSSSLGAERYPGPQDLRRMVGSSLPPPRRVSAPDPLSASSPTNHRGNTGLAPHDGSR